MAASTVNENRRIARNHLDSVWNLGEFDTEVLAEGYHVVKNMGGTEELSLEEYRQIVDHFRSAFPDLHKEPDQVIATGDTVVIPYTFTGTHEGELQGIPPTGNEVEVAAVDICRIEDGKIAREWFVADFLGMMQQLGVVE